MKTLFLQLPEQDPANLHSTQSTPLFAGSLLAQAVKLGVLSTAEFSLLNQDISDFGGDAAILKALIKDKLDAIFFCLYDYNYERSLHIARILRARLPATSLVALGPEVFPGAAVSRSRIFDSQLEISADNEWRNFCYPQVDGFATLLADLRQRSLQPRYDSSLSSLSGSLAPESKDPYLSGIITIQPDKPVFIGMEPLDILPPNRILEDLLKTAPLIIQKACNESAREIVLADPGLADMDKAKAFLKTLAAANHQGVSLQLYWPADRLDEDLAKLLIDANLVAMRSPLLSTNPATLQTLGLNIDQSAIERNASYIWAQSAILKLRLYLGLPGDSYDNVIDTFDFLGMAGLGQEAELKPLCLLPGTVCQKQAADFGITDALTTAPYTVLETSSMQEEDFLDAFGDFEESFDVAVSPPVRPCLQMEKGGFISCIDTRVRGALDQLLVCPEKLANSLTLIIDADNPEAIKRLTAMAKDIRRENYYTLWQLILYSDNAIPSDEIQNALIDAFAMTEHYFELQHLFSLDPQNTWQTRLFFATNSEPLALRSLHEVRELETIFIIKDKLPAAKLVEATPFMAFNRERMGFEMLYDLMNLYRNFQDLLLETSCTF